MSSIQLIKETGYVKNDDGRELFYEYIRPADRDDASCTVLGHGYGGNNQRPYIVTVKDICHSINRATLAFDFTGCGKSSGQLGHLTPDVAKRDFQTMLRFSRDLKGIDPTHRSAFGTSFGANALLRCMAEEDADDLEVIFAHVPVPKEKKVVNLLLNAKIWLKEGKKLSEMAYDDIVPVSIGDSEFHLSRAFQEQMRDMNLRRDVVPRIKSPTVIIGAGNDFLVSAKKLEELKGAFPEKTPVRLEIFKKAGHVFNDKQLAKMGEIIKETLIGLPSARSRSGYLIAI